MSNMTFDEFLTNVLMLDELEPEALAYRGTVQVSTPTGQGRVMATEPVWRFVERDAVGHWALDPQHTQDLYLMARWITSSYGRNTTGSGPLRTEAEKDVRVPLCQLLDKVCPIVTWTQARKLFHDIATGDLGERGTYTETTGDGVLEEYEFTYAYHAVKLYPLYQWLSVNKLHLPAQRF